MNFDYPPVYPKISPQDEAKLRERNVLLIDRYDAQKVLTPEMSLAVLEEAFKEEAVGSAANRTKANILIPTSDVNSWYRFASMEGGIRSKGVVAIRLKSDIVRNYSTSEKSRQDWYSGYPGRFFGLILLFNAEDGTPLAMLHDSHIQHMRVATTHALATRYLARKDSSVLGIIGSGGMALAHAMLLTKVRPIRRIKVYSPNRDHKLWFADNVSRLVGVRTEPTDDPREAVRGSDIVATCTNANQPVLFGDWLENGMHIVLTLDHKEMDDDGWRKLDKLVYYESPPGIDGSSSETYWTSMPDKRFAGGKTPTEMERRRRLVGHEKINRLTELLTGAASGRENDKQITATVSEGTGVQFAALALKVYQEARANGLGRGLPLDWFLQDVTN